MNIEEGQISSTVKQYYVHTAVTWQNDDGQKVTKKDVLPKAHGENLLIVKSNESVPRFSTLSSTKAKENI